jgi:poly(beta-D-mannuronate) lyase
MLRIILFSTFLFLAFSSLAKTIIVKTSAELNKANTEAMPGDIIILQDGPWNNITITLNCNGSSTRPIYFKAATPGKVLITGNSKLLLGGSFIVVDGFCFENGYSGKDAVIKFCIDKKQIAHNCRVTNTVINDFNNPKRLDENYWVALYGKNNRLDHCSFINKKNIGVLMAVILEDESSRENFHLVDHNYFGFRLPLASNGGEIIRVGVSEQCEFNSNTSIVDNFFEYCDGETEIISVKSCHNLVANNLFKECQGGVVLRHGHYNTVQNNIFFGNGKAGTGGVRIINRGQWVINNLFYKCRGVDFRSPLSIMNGVPNSPANRYVAVSDAAIANNYFYECSPISFCEGSDAERTEAPKNVQFLNNVFINTKDSLLYHEYDDIAGIKFSGNMVSKTIHQPLASGFIKTASKVTMQDGVLFPAYRKSQANEVPDSLQKAALTPAWRPACT